LALATFNSAYAIARCRIELSRLYSVLDKRLRESKYLAGDKYTIADIAHYSSVRIAHWSDVDIREFPALERWCETIGEREAVKRATLVPEGGTTEEQRAEFVEREKQRVRAMDNTDRY